MKLEKNIITSNYEKMLLKSQIEIQEHTYSALGKELHDNIGQLLSTTKMLLGLTERAMDSPPDTLLTANATLGKAISELRSLSKSLDREWLEQFDFIENLTAEITRINSGALIRCTLLNPFALDLASDRQIILFRIVQEAMQNAIKHASPKNISVNMTSTGYHVQVSISDDGTGFNTVEVTKGMGFINMNHRVNSLQGTVVVQSGIDTGTEVTISIPINQL